MSMKFWGVWWINGTNDVGKNRWVKFDELIDVVSVKLYIVYKILITNLVLSIKNNKVIYYKVQV